MEVTVDEALNMGIEAHKAGKLEEADRYYTAIIQAAPKHPEANHNLGVLAVDVGKTLEALPFFQAALETNSNASQFWISYINALIILERMDEARIAVEEASQKVVNNEVLESIQQRLNGETQGAPKAKSQVNDSSSHDGNILDSKSLNQAVKFAKHSASKGEVEESKLIYQDILERFPMNKKALQGLKSLAQISSMDRAKNVDPPSTALQPIFNAFNNGQFEQSLSQANLLRVRFSNSAMLYNISGAANAGLGNLEEAIDCYQLALKLKPDLAEAHVNMGNALQNKGDLKQAIDCYKKALDINADLFQAYNNLGNALQAKGDVDTAIKNFQKATKLKPDYAAAFVNLGTAMQQKGNYEGAIESYETALKIDPNYALALSNMGNVLRVTGSLDSAVECFRKALKIDPNYAEAHNNLGNALRDAGDLNAALNSYQEALNSSPNHALVHSNMGSVFQDMGSFDEAIMCYRKALKINPELVEAHANMGASLRDKGDLDAALESYKKAILVNPDFALAYSNMGNVLKDKGDLNGAIKSYQKAIKIKSDYADAYRNLGLALTGKVFMEPCPGLDESIISLLEQKTFAHPRNLAASAVSLIKLSPAVKHALLKCSGNIVEESLQETVEELSATPLLLKLMSVCALPDGELEELLIKIRSFLLLNSADAADSVTILNFQSALALQCFTNEYVYPETEKEVGALTVLEASIEECLLNGIQPKPVSVLCLASYRPLHDYHWCHLLSLSLELQEVGTRQILDRDEEERLKSEMPILAEITDNVSSKVRDQYEANPYPRWVNSWLAVTPKRVSAIVKEANLRLLDSTVTEAENLNILVAGCGTGQHSLAVASHYRNSKVLAVDLSLSSLAYAKRKTNELGVLNLEYMQADILDLAKLNRQFHLIESGGVLHHMEDPMAGWAVLTNCLKPGGLMKIGLYSELARRDVVKMREEIAQLGIEPSDVEMKKYRDNVFHSSREHHKRIQSFEDFYGLSEFRDLLFHVQEHRFTLLEIESCLAELGLSFCGIDHPEIVKNFRKSFNRPDELYDLGKWNSFENDNPNTFAGMYQFWCQKVV
ncbi:MAG: tetratricopeptide (TPR) repeat protein/SAM-dependent methyltransferase [Pseudohongiellaceae bacterium]|jgi:tetratricopeptide (TPR) repeat protein/SAM-dependent methyltransferase